MTALRRSWRTLVGLILALFLAVVGSTFLFPPPGVGHEGPDEEHRPIAQPENPVELQIALGIKDTVQEPWQGSLKISEGKVLDLAIVQASRDSTVTGSNFTVKAARQPAAQKKANKAKKANQAKQAADDTKPAAQKKKKKQQAAAAAADAIPLVPARLRALLDARDSATVTVDTGRGSFSFALADIASGKQKEFLDGQASVQREVGAGKLTGADTEDDFPAMARGRDGSIWLVYVAYRKGPDLIPERFQAGNFESLETKGGDEIRLMRFDGKTWHHVGTASQPGIDVWRPTVAVDGNGNVIVAWAQPLNDDWNILAQQFQPAKEPDGKGKWGEVQVVTDAKGSDFHVVAATDSHGKVWLAWQGWRGNNYEILMCSQHPTAGWSEPKKISRSPRNDWSPAIAADSKGRVFVVWDSYDRGNYDVLLHREGDSGAPMVVADSARFEARPSLLCDKQDRLWVAYEEGDEQWGKDYASENQFRNVGLDKNPGFALYVNRTVKTRCLVDGKWQQPASDLTQAFGSELNRNKSLPRLAGDSAGGIWLLLRQHPLANGNGEVWHSYATRFNGEKWSEVKHLPSSSNLLDNRPALAAHADGMLAVYSGDSRNNTASRGQDDLFSMLLSAKEPVVEAQLQPVSANGAAQLESVHDNEDQVVKRLREFRLDAAGKSLQLVRGEFHRHTEFTSHRDQDGLLEDSWRYSLDAGSLDWMGNGDHDNGTQEYMWWINQKQCDLHHNPPHFVAAMSYERSVVYPNGHRNVIMPRRFIRPLPRGDMTGTPETGTNDTKMLYAYLKHFGGMCASHTSGTNMGTDWRDNDPEVEPVVEIYQGHRHNYEHFGAPRSATAQTQIGGYQPAGFIWNALEKGYKLGFQSSSDHVSTHMSYAMVLATGNSRPAIIDAFKQRHCYGATDNILLVVRSGDHLMGDIFKTKEKPKLSIQAIGGKSLAKISIVRDNKYVYTDEPGTIEVRREFTDMDTKAGETHYYYVRVEQADGNLAWASPMWITYQP